MSLKTTMVGLCVILSLLGLPTKGSTEASPTIKVLTLDDHLTQVFGEEAHLMKAIAMAESNLEVNQVSYNCRINGKNKPCRKRSLAWSSDCGLLQINVKGKSCPPHLLTIEGNLKEAKKIKDEQGLRAWAVYKSKRYKKYL